MSEFRGRVLLIVNVASRCGLRPQLLQLEALYKDFSKEPFTILAFPSNDFGNQEPLDASAAQDFCRMEYGVTFPVLEKVRVKGNKQHPLYEFLSSRALNGRVNASPKWNFHKYLVDHEGMVRDHFLPITPPGNKIRKAIRKLLDAIPPSE